MRPVSILSSALVAACFMTAAASAQILARETVVPSLPSRPVYITHAPGDSSRIFIVEQGGRIDVYDLTTNSLKATPFLASIPNLNSVGEAGLLGMAFDPNYASNGYFYTYSTRNSGPWGSAARVVDRWHVSTTDPNTADAASITTVLHVDRSIANHNAGWIGFGPDNLLYIAIGEGGVSTNSQIITNNLLGKVLRIDVSGDDFPADAQRNYRIPPTNPFVGIDGDDEIWAYGLRNPYRCCFDAATNEFIIADVGQSAWEEINVQPANNPAALPGQPGYCGGLNYGWTCYEGATFRGGAGCPSSDQVVFPVATYPHGAASGPLGYSGCSIIGGEVYRGCAIPGLVGKYLFVDFCQSTLVSVRLTPTGISDVKRHTNELSASSCGGFGTDALGEIYFGSGNGLFKIVAAPGFRLPDCNNNGRADACDIAAGLSADTNNDGIPDDCACLADWDHNTLIQPADLAAYVNAWLDSLANSTLEADFDHTGAVNPADLALFVNAWLAALSTGCY